MKKLFITIAFVAATMFASAQLYVGGNLGFETSNGKQKAEETQDLQKCFTFEIVPSVGYMFNEKMGVGLDFGLVFDKDTYPKGSEYQGAILDEDLQKKNTSWLIAPYFRYVFAEIDNFKFYGDAKISLGGGKDKVKYDGETNDGDKTFKFGIGIVPGMAYMLTDNISMNCQLDILSLGFNSIKTTTPVEEGDDIVETHTYFGLHANYATPIKIGFFYTF